MICKSCRAELKEDAHFCKKCGEPVVNRGSRSASRPATKRDKSRDSKIQRRQSQIPDQVEFGVIVPLSDRSSAPAPDKGAKDPESEIVSIPPPPRIASPPSAKKNRIGLPTPPAINKNRVTTPIERKAIPSPLKPDPPVPRSEPKSQPASRQAMIFESDLRQRPQERTEDKDRQRRTTAVVPLVLLTVILLFVFAYIAAR